ncbi:hypothetical protein HDU67_003357, partial [Dinochytrium kinnereticum]
MTPSPINPTDLQHLRLMLEVVKESIRLKNAQIWRDEEIRKTLEIECEIQKIKMRALTVRSLPLVDVAGKPGESPQGTPELVYHAPASLHPSPSPPQLIVTAAEDSISFISSVDSNWSLSQPPQPPIVPYPQF